MIQVNEEKVCQTRIFFVFHVDQTEDMGDNDYSEKIDRELSDRVIIRC